jgi:hypothetical protein
MGKASFDTRDVGFATQMELSVKQALGEACHGIA